MSASVEATFKLVDKASATLNKIGRKAEALDAKLDVLGKKIDVIGDKFETAAVKAQAFNEQLDKIDGRKVDVKVNVNGVAEAVAETKALDTALDSVDRKVRTRTSKQGGLISKFFGGLPTFGNSNLESIFGKLDQGANTLTRRLKPLGQILGGITGGITGMAMAFGPMGLAVAALLPLLPPLIGGLTALLGVVTGFVGGAALIGGGIFGAMAVGLGSVALVAKQALTPLKAYSKAVGSLNKALASGDPKQIAKAQIAVNNLAKANPGIAKLYTNFKKLTAEFAKITKPAKKTLLDAIGVGLADAAKALPKFRQDVIDNTKAASDAFKGLVNTLTGPEGRQIIHSFSGLFQQIIGPLTKGITQFALGFAHLVQHAMPDIERLAGGFKKLGDRFNEWAKGKGGRSFVKEAIADFKALGTTIGLTGKILIDLFFGPGAAAKAGRKNLIDTLNGSLRKIDKWLNDPKNAGSLRKFFKDSAKDLADFIGALSTFARGLFDLGKKLSPLKDLVMYLVKHPEVIFALTGGFIAAKGVKGAAKGAGLGGKLFDKLLGPGGAKGGPGKLLRDLGGLGKQDGSMAKPFYVVVMDKGGPHGKPKGPPGEPSGEPVPGKKGPGKSDPGTEKRGPLSRAARALGLKPAEDGLTKGALGRGGLIGALLTGFAGAGRPGVRQTPLNTVNAFLHGVDPLRGLPLLNHLAPSNLLPGVKHTMGMTIFGGPSPSDIRARGSIPGSPQASGIGQGKRGGWFDVLTARVKDLPRAFNAPVTKATERAATDVVRFRTAASKAADGTHKNIVASMTALAADLKTQTASMTGDTATKFDAMYTEMQKDLQKINGPSGGNSISSIANAVGKVTKKGAKGTRIPGTGLHDNVLVAPNTMAAPGELIVNRHTEGRVNSLLSAFGTSLGREVGRETKPHYAAKGTRTGGQGRADTVSKGAGQVAGSNVSGANFGGHPSNVVPGIARLIALMERKFPLSVTSTTDHSLRTTTGGISDHVSGHAVDLSGSPAVMSKAVSYIMSSGLYRKLKQGIHNPGLSINQGQVVPSSFWAQAWGQHANHIHLALAGALGAFSGLGSAPHLKSRTAGGKGMFKAAGQGVLDKLRKGGNRRLAKAFAASMGGGGDLGGMTSAGGQYDLGQLEKLWVQAGGPPNAAHLMAAIALAESGGNANAHNASGATGLWQILGNPFPGNARNPGTNARMAVSKFNSQGLGAWVTYTSGAYRKYMANGGRVPTMQSPQFGGWFGNGGSITANRPTFIGIGEHGTETATVHKGTAGKKGAGIHIGELHVHGGDSVKREVIKAFHELSREIDRQPVLAEEEHE